MAHDLLNDRHHRVALDRPVKLKGSFIAILMLHKQLAHIYNGKSYTKSMLNQFHQANWGVSYGFYSSVNSMLDSQIHRTSQHSHSQNYKLAML